MHTPAPARAHGHLRLPARSRAHPTQPRGRQPRQPGRHTQGPGCCLSRGQLGLQPTGCDRRGENGLWRNTSRLTGVSWPNPGLGAATTLAVAPRYPFGCLKAPSDPDGHQGDTLQSGPALGGLCPPPTPTPSLPRSAPSWWECPGQGQGSGHRWPARPWAAASSLDWSVQSRL